jgi:hypothetical protein
VTLGDGRIIPIDEVWQKVTDAKTNTGFPAIGTWDRLSYTTTGADGKKRSYTKPAATCFEIITPSHWMRLSYRNNKFERASGGTYTVQGDKVYPKVDFASSQINKNEKIEVTVVVSGPGGKKVATVEEVLVKVNAKPQVQTTAVTK